MMKVSSIEVELSYGDTNERPEDTNQNRSYRPPQLYQVVRTIDLVQGYTGKHTDQYQGYYWNQE